MERLMTTEAAEAALGLGSGTLRVDRCRGTLGVPYVRLGRAVRYRPRDVEAWLAARVRVPGASGATAKGAKGAKGKAGR